MKQFIRRVCSLLDIEEPQLTYVDKLVTPTMTGAISSDTTKLYLKEGLREEDAFFTVAHELRHKWQMLKSPELLKFDQPYSMDCEKYNQQPAEVDASAFAKLIIMNYLNKVPLFNGYSDEAKKKIEERAVMIRTELNLGNNNSDDKEEVFFTKEEVCRIERLGCIDMFNEFYSVAAGDAGRILRFLAENSPESTLHPNRLTPFFSSTISDTVYSKYTYLIQVLINGIHDHDVTVCSVVEEMLRSSHKQVHRYMRRTSLLTMDDIKVIGKDRSFTRGAETENDELKHIPFLILCADAMNVKVSASVKHILADSVERTDSYQTYTDTEIEKAKTTAKKLDDPNVKNKVMEMLNGEEGYEAISRESEKIVDMLALIECVNNGDFGIRDIICDIWNTEGNGHKEMYQMAADVVNTMYPEEIDNSPFISAMSILLTLLGHISILAGNAKKDYISMFDDIEKKPDFESSFVDLSRVTIKKNVNSTVQKPLNNLVEISIPEDSQEQQEEIEKKRRAYQEISQKYAELKGELANCQKQIEELTDELETSNYELQKLREYAYSTTDIENAESEKDEVSQEDKEESIKEKKIVIIGGDMNWVKKLRSKFPNWIFIDAERENTSIEAPLCNADRIFVFTKVLSHSMWYKVVGILRNHKLDFSYIKDVNISRNIDQVYNYTVKYPKNIT